MSPFALALVVSLAGTSGDGPIRLMPGSQEILKQQGINRVAVGDPEVVDVKVTGPNELLMLGKRRGRTNLTLWVNGKTISRTVVVDDGGATEIARLVKLTVNPSLKVDTFNDRIVIDGFVDSTDEMRRLQKLVGDDGNVTVLVKMNPRVLPLIAEQINQALAKNGMPSAKAVVVGQRLVLEGSVSDPSELQKAQTIADAYYAGW
jgi:Flp pilus assembly secretin CpaC